MGLDFETKKKIVLLIRQAKALKENINRSLNDTATESLSRYVSFKTYALCYNEISQNATKILGLPKDSFSSFNTSIMPGHMDAVWGIQKEIMEMVALETDILISFLEGSVDFAEDEFDNISNFIKSKLRASVFSRPDKEVQVQNTIESLLIGRDMVKGIDYDRESGKLEFSGKEYIPDFILPKMNLCVEVKLLREGKRSQVIDVVYWPNTDSHADRRRMFETLHKIIPELRCISLRDRDMDEPNVVGEGLEYKTIPLPNDSPILLLQWRRKNIESYLLCPKAIALAAGKEVEEIKKYFSDNFALAIDDDGYIDAEPPEPIITLDGKHVFTSENVGLERHYHCNKYSVAAQITSSEVCEDIKCFLSRVNTLFSD